jgi:predicted TIM-barrel fold metal-dependent hydrolase
VTSDAHLHLGTRETASPYFLQLIEERFAPAEVARLLSVDGALQEMDRAQVDRAFILPMAFDAAHIPAGNQVLASAFRSHPDRFVGFGTVDVHELPSRAADAIDRLKDSGFGGIKLHPAFQQFDPADRRIFGIYERASEVGMPILMHTGVSTRFFSDRLCRPMAMDDALCEFANLVVVLAHGGRLWYEEAAMILRKHPNAYIDISANVAKDGSPMLLRRLLRVVKSWTGDLERVLFGTDYPSYTQTQTRALLEACCVDQPGQDGPALGRADLDLILGNADRLIGRINWR